MTIKMEVHQLAMKLNRYEFNYKEACFLIAVIVGSTNVKDLILETAKQNVTAIPNKKEKPNKVKNKNRRVH